MSGLSQQMCADVERMFLDWGEPAQLLEVSQQYDPAGGQLEEVSFSRELQVIRSEDQPHQVGHVSATLNLTRRLLLVRRAELPAHEALTSARIVLGDTPYQIRSVRESRLGGVLVLDCVTSGLKDE